MAITTLMIRISWIYLQTSMMWIINSSFYIFFSSITNSCEKYCIKMKNQWDATFGSSALKENVLTKKNYKIDSWVSQIYGLPFANIIYKVKKKKKRNE